MERKLFADGIHDDTAALQALLDQGGEVYFPSGKYLVSRPLIIRANTHLRAARGAHLRLADGANCSLLDNEGLYTRTPDVNITVEGGIWDGNHANQSRVMIENENAPCDEQIYIGNSLLVLLMRFVHTQRLTLRDITFRDPTSYALHVADATYFNIENTMLDFDLSKPNMDGVHIQGPARFGRITNVTGNANDDHIALCTNGTVRSEITSGPIEDVDIDGLYCDNGYTGVRLLSCGEPLRNVNIRNIHGDFRFYAVSFTHHYPLRDKPPVLENITVSDCTVSKSHGDFPPVHRKPSLGQPLFFMEKGCRIRNVEFRNITRHERNPETLAATFLIEEGAEAEDIRIRGLRETFCGETAPTLRNPGGADIDI